MNASSTSRHPLSKILAQRPKGPMRSPARALGWFSIGLGVAELLMPRTLARMSGVPAGPLLVRACGLREIATGIGLLTAQNPAPWLWGRVVGDALDITAASAGLLGARPTRALATVAVLGGVTAVDTACAQAASRGPRVAVCDYSMRSGFPKPAAEMRGAAHDEAAPNPSTRRAVQAPGALDDVSSGSSGAAIAMPAAGR